MVNPKELDLPVKYNLQLDTERPLEPAVAHFFTVYDPLDVRVDLFNTGTLPVEELRTAMTLPYQWEAEVSPPLIQKIEPGEKEPIHITIIPPRELGVGEYDLYVEAFGMVGSDKVEAERKNITIRVAARANILGNALLIGGLMLLVVGIAVVSIKVSRR